MRISLRFIVYSLLPFFLGCSQNTYHKETRLLMGTIVEITCQDKFAIKQAFEEIEKIDKLANKFSPNSELSRLNKNGEIKASEDLFTLVKESLKFYNLSDGAFDITIAPIADIWKEVIKDSESGKFVLPSEDEIKEKLKFVGSDKIILSHGQSLIKFSQPNMAIDLGAIAKGYAVDKAVMRFKAMGVNSALINAGGNIYCLGKNNHRRWHIGIRHPRKQENIIYYLDLENQAVATSGDYEQYAIFSQRRYSHIISPKTGYPVNNNIISVTIVADNATLADALSTTVFVLGKEKGTTFTKDFANVEVRVIEEDAV